MLLDVAFLIPVPDAPDYTYKSNKTAPPPKAVNGSLEKHTKPMSRAPTKNSVCSAIQPDQSTPLVTTKAGRKRSRASLD